MPEIGVKDGKGDKIFTFQGSSRAPEPKTKQYNNYMSPREQQQSNRYTSDAWSPRDAGKQAAINAPPSYQPLKLGANLNKDL